MRQSLPLELIRQDIQTQLDAAREIFAIITELKELVTTTGENSPVEHALTHIMQHLLDIGRRLHDNAAGIGTKVRDLSDSSGM